MGQKMETFKISELGCKVNQYESQLMREQLQRAGFAEANGKPADIYVVNTCTVTASADSGSRNLIRRALRENPRAKIVAAGCYAEKDADEIIKICKDAIILKNKEKDNIVSFLHHTRLRPSSLVSRLSSHAISGFAGHNRAFVKIEDGCSNSCSYCKVPLVRGKARNRPSKEIIAEIRNLAEAGFKEIVLCGICLGAYKDLTGLLGKLENIERLKRIRLSSIEPIYVDDKLIDKISSSQKICRHLHIPLQSGDDKILKAMDRKYTSSRYLKIIDRIRRKMPQIAIATDVLVGFPGETDKQFRNTLKVLESVRPMRTHVFTFSAREGTPAFYMPGGVDKKEKSQRLNAVKQFAEEMSFSYRKNFLGRDVDVLVESSRDRKTNLLTGYTDTYIKVLFEGNDTLINELAKVKITRVLPDCTIGQVKENVN